MASPFTFNTQGTGNSGGSQNKPLFGAASSSANTTPSIFGTTNTSSGTPSTNLFGSGTTALNTPSVFGGGASSTPATSKPGGLFGAAQPTAGAPSTSTLGAGFGFGKTGGDAAKPSMFGAPAGAATGGAATSAAPSFGFGTASGSITAATPAANKTSFLPSTTPAGAPPGNSMFGQNKQVGGTTQTGSLMFGTTNPQTSTSTAAPTPFGSGNSAFSTAQPLGGSVPSPGLFKLGATSSLADANKTTPATASTPAGLFNAASQPSALGPSSTQAAPKTGIFGGLGSTTPSSTPAKPLGFNIGTTPAAQPTSSHPAATSTPAFTLGGNNATPASSATPTSNLFTGAAANAAAPTSGGTAFNWGKQGTSTLAGTPALTGATTTATSGGASTAATATSSTFPTLGGTTGSSPFPSLSGGTSAPPASAGATTAATATSLFNKPTTSEAQPPSSATAPKPTPTLGTTTRLAGNNAAKTGLASSTAGPAPSAQSRLKNKSMDEIITRWAADLSKYQKEFQQQAETVAQWDRALVENSDKVRKLYAKTFQAERDAAEVERQLTMMEENQQELDSYLDRYEKEIENLMKMHGVSGKSDGLRGPDQERERTYKLAEKLQDRLNELNKDLTEMIEEINSTSQTLSKTGKPDDPLTKVVRVLNTQLAQLQLIDSGASQLREKIAKAQNESQHVGGNGWNGLGTDAAADFYRSYRGGRSERFGGVS